METETGELNNLPEFAPPVRHKARIKAQAGLKRIVLRGEKNQSQNCYILSDSVYITFLK